MTVSNGLVKETTRTKTYHVGEVIPDRFPNAETIKAIMEAEQLLSDPNAKRYKSVDALFAELNRP